jgi:hypothetical protein
VLAVRVSVTAAPGVFGWVYVTVTAVDAAVRVVPVAYAVPLLSANMVAAQAVKTMSARAPFLFFDTDKSMEDLPFLWGLLHDIAERRSSIPIARGHIGLSTVMSKKFPWFFPERPRLLT